MKKHQNMYLYLHQNGEGVASFADGVGTENSQRQRGPKADLGAAWVLCIVVFVVSMSAWRVEFAS